MATTPNAARRDETEDEKQSKDVTITVNEQKVQLEKKTVTGLEIKDAAIAQGVKIQRNFVLTEELPGDKSRVVRDDETVKVNKHSEFTAVTPDDNS